MAIRVKVNINFGKSEVQTIALANSGYEGDETEIVILSAGEKIWKFSDERKIRKSENKQTW